MPTFTTTGLTTFSNLGPLTTIFTAPASCTEAPTTGLGLAPSFGPGGGIGIAFSDYCPKPNAPLETWSIAPCVPSGKKFAEAINKENTKEPYNYIYPYYSPAFDCPSAWTTVGKATKDQRGSLTGSAGIFQNPYTDTPTDAPVQVDFWPNEFLHALDKGETAVACCPSGYTGIYYGGCYSTMPFESYTKSSACITYIAHDDSPTFPVTTKSIWWYGSTTSAELAVDAPEGTKSEPTYTMTVKIGATPTFPDTKDTSEPLEDSYYYVVVYENMVRMVHRGQDGNGTASQNGEGDDGESAGSRTGVTTGMGLMATLGIWGLAAVAGACLMV